MNIVIIPGFTGHPDEVIFEDLEKQLITAGHSITKIAWPHFPNGLNKYSFSETIDFTRNTLEPFNMDETTLLGFSMGGILACYLASEFHPKKLGLISSPYQAGSEDDLDGKYKEWKEQGYRDVTSSKYGNLRIPFSFIEDARQYNVLDIIQNIYCPTLFIVGEKDDSVPPKVTARIFAKANEPKEWHVVAGMEHKYKTQPEVIKKVNELIIGFMNKE